MPAMSDPMNALVGLQHAVDSGAVKLQNCEIYSDIGVYMDQPNEKVRITYAKVVDKSVQAIVMFVQTDRLNGIPCFNVGYAVIESLRGQGLATITLNQCLEELCNGFKRNGAVEFYVEAVISVLNEASIKVAERAITRQRKPCNDVFSGEAALQYLKLVKCS